MSLDMIFFLFLQIKDGLNGQAAKFEQEIERLQIQIDKEAKVKK